MSLVHPGIDLRRPEWRSELEKRRREAKQSLRAGSKVEKGIDHLYEIGADLDLGIARVKTNMLASSLTWSDQDEVLARWIELQHRALVKMAGVLLDLARARPAHLMPRLIASSLHHWAEAIKWSTSSETADFAALHELYMLSLATGRQREKFLCKVDGGARRTSIEALYFRALLLDRWNGGCLTRAQLEVIDGWLWEWGDLLRAERQPPQGEPFLRVDLDTRAGLREGTRETSGPVIYLGLGKLEEDRRRIAVEMQRGRLIPSHGCAAELRVEDHVAALDHVTRVMRAPTASPAARERKSARGTRIEVWRGLGEIGSRGFSVGIETGRFPALKLDGEALEQAATMRFNHATRRYFWLSDESSTGLGLEALVEDAGGIEVGEILGWRRTPGGPVFLGRVARRQRRAGGEIFFGLQLLTQCAQPIMLSATNPRTGADEMETHLFVPGADPSGVQDSFLIPESAYDKSRVHSTHAGGRRYALRFNRIRARGRGWCLAGFEMVEPQRGGPAQGPQPTAKPTAGNDAPDDPWQREVRAKLM